MSSGSPFAGGGPAGVAPPYLAGFEVLDELGRGGRTVTYRVRRDSSIYAMKILPGSAVGQVTERAFRREAALLAALSDPGLVRVYEVGVDYGCPYLVMEYVEGRPLSSLVADGPFPLGQLLRLGIDVASALGAAHEARLVHRDIKPENILVDSGGQARVIDFGLAVRPGDPDDVSTAGTLLYSAPEQSGMLHRPVDGRADLYALGAVLYECATGRPPYSGHDVGELLRQHATAAPPDPRAVRPDLPPAVCAAVVKLLGKDPDDRYQTAAGLVHDLRRLVAGEVDFPLARHDHIRGRRDQELIGRDEELGRLTRRWEGVHAGEGGSIVLLEGAPGSGKSRLAREVATAVRMEGGLVLFGECRPDGGAPLAPVRQAVDGLLAAVAALPEPLRDTELARVRHAAGSSASLLRGLSPALDAVLDAPELADEDRHQQFPVAVAGFLAALATGAGGALLHIDDVQWISPQTRRVLQHLSERLADVPLLVLITGRSGGEPADATQLRSSLGPALDVTIRLGPLSAFAVGALASAYTGGLVVDEATAASLAARSDGNPFTLLQYVDAALDAGLLCPDWGRWRLDTAQLHTVELSSTGVELVLGRLDGLDTDSRQLLGVGAVVGSVFDPQLVADAYGLPSHKVFDVADTAAWRNLVERREHGRYAFLHDRIREALLAQFDAEALRGVHQRLADALDTSRDTDPDAVFALARHCQAGEPARNQERVFRACYAAGQLALTDLAPAEALRLLERAAEAAASVPITADSAFLYALGTAQYWTGQFEVASRTCTIAIERATDPIERARILYLMSQSLDTAWAIEEEIAVIDQALAQLGRAPAKRTGALLVSTLWTYVLGKAIRITRLGYGGASKGRKLEVSRLESTLYAAAAWAEARQLQPLRSLLFILRQMYPASRTGAGAEEARLRIGLAYSDYAVGWYRRALTNTARARAAARRSGDPVLVAFVAYMEAFNRHNQGLDQSEALRQLVVEQSRWLDIGLQSDIMFILWWDALQRGLVVEAQRVAERREALTEFVGAEGSDATEHFLHGTSVRGALAALRVWQGRADEAWELVREPTVGVHSDWAYLPVYGAAMIVAYEARDLGEEFDRAVTDFDSIRLPMRALIPFALGFYVWRAMGRLEQTRLAPPEQRAARLRQALDALKLLRQAARVPLLRAYYELMQASLLQITGEPRKALAQLAAAETFAIAVDAPAVAYEAARVRALVLRDLNVVGEADRAARSALAIAVEYEWTARIRHTMAEFGLGEIAATGPAVAMPTDAVALGRYRERLAAIEQLGIAASRVLEPERLAAVALDETIRILGAERAFLFLMDGTPARLVPHRGRDADGHDIEELAGYSASTVERVRRTGQPVVLAGTEDAVALGAQSMVLHGLRSIMVAPVQLDGRLLGIVYLDSRVAKGIFTADDVGLLIAITNHVAVALETARAAQLEVAVAAANRQRDLAETLRDALADITGTLQPEPEAVLLRLLRTTVGVVGGERGWLILGTPQDLRLRVVADTSSTVESDLELARLLARETTLVSDSSPVRADLLAEDQKCWLAVPLRTRVERLGALIVSSSLPHAFDDGRADLASALVGQAMVAYENARLFAQVQQLATIDDLTGIANRRHFFDLAARELDRARRTQGGLLALMIDIDLFKTINDGYGHLVGDQVLRIVANRLSRFARSYDVLGRYGGEEFALLMPNGSEDAIASAERVRAAIADTPVPTSAGPMTVTVSIGAARLAPEDVDVSALLARADRRLYEAKRGGRNRVAAD
jgi:diguanylate cyclase (GGDEF)-like protein